MTPYHAYNDPDITPLEFLLACMRDPDLPLTLRMKAAEYAAPYCEARPAPVREPALTIYINGAEPRLSNEPEPEPDQLHLQMTYELLGVMGIKGHA